MEHELVSKFISNLIRETVNGIVSWNPLFQIVPPKDGTNTALVRITSEDEFHHINYENSFYLRTNRGIVFLVDQWRESGRDGTVFDGYNLYIQPNENAEITLVLSNTDELYRLSNAIKEKSGLSEDAIKFMNEYLNR